MYRRDLTLKQKTKVFGPAIKANLKPIPDNWADFAALCRIRSGNKIIHFNPYPYQIQLSDCIDNHYGTLVTKSRQLGITETVANKFLHKAAKNPGYVAVVLSKTFADVANIAKRIRQMADSLPDYIALETQNLTDIKIFNGGRILFRPSTPNGTRGLESISDILFDEWAFVDNPDLIYTSAVPATEMVGEAARLIMLSTPNGKSGFYFDRLVNGNGDKDVMQICQDIRAGKLDPVQIWTDENGWGKFILHWKAHPLYSQIPNYLDQIRSKKGLSEAAVSQEYDLSFEDSEVNVFTTELIRSGAIGEFRGPMPGAAYYAGLDCSTIGDDYTVCTIGHWTDHGLDLVAMHRGRKASMDYHLDKIADLIVAYRPKVFGIEITGGTGQIYLEQLSKRFPGVSFEAIRTTGDSKPAMIDRVALALEKSMLRYPPGPIVDEFLSFRRNGKKLEAAPGYHDDCLMSLAFCLEVSPFKEMKQGFIFTSIPRI